MFRSKTLSFCSVFSLDARQALIFCNGQLLLDLQNNTTQKHNLSFSSPVSSCLVLLMANFEEEIRDLKAEITKNTARLDKAIDEGNEEDKKLFGNLITAKHREITALRVRGKVIIPSRLSTQHRCLQITDFFFKIRHE